MEQNEQQNNQFKTESSAPIICQKQENQMSFTEPTPHETNQNCTQEQQQLHQDISVAKLMSTSSRNVESSNSLSNPQQTNQGHQSRSQSTHHNKQINMKAKGMFSKMHVLPKHAIISHKQTNLGTNQTYSQHVNAGQINQVQTSDVIVSAKRGSKSTVNQVMNDVYRHTQQPMQQSKQPSPPQVQASHSHSYTDLYPPNLSLNNSSTLRSQKVFHPQQSLEEFGNQRKPLNVEIEEPEVAQPYFINEEQENQYNMYQEVYASEHSQKLLRNLMLQQSNNQVAQQKQQINNINAQQQDIHIHLNYGQAQQFPALQQEAIIAAAAQQQQTAILDQSSQSTSEARPADKYRQNILIDRPARKGKQSSSNTITSTSLIQKANTITVVEQANKKMTDHYLHKNQRSQNNQPISLLNHQQSEQQYIQNTQTSLQPLIPVQRSNQISLQQSLPQPQSMQNPSDDPTSLSIQNSSFSTNNDQSSQSFRRKAKVPQQQQQQSIVQLTAELRSLKSIHAQHLREYEQKISALQNDSKTQRMRYKNLEEVHKTLKNEIEDFKVRLDEKDAQVTELTVLNQELDKDLIRVNEDLQEVQTDFRKNNSQLRISKAHLESVIKVATCILEHIVTKCQIQVDNGRPRSQSQSQISDFGATQLSSSTDQLDKSYEDERRNLVEQIKNVLSAKLEAVQKTVIGIQLNEYIANIRGWRFDWFQQQQHQNQSMMNPSERPVSQKFLSPLTQTQRTQQFFQRSGSGNSLSMYTSQKGGDTMSNLFTQQQHSFYSKEKDAISFFGPRKDEEEKEKGQQFLSGSGDLPHLGNQMQTLGKGSRESDNSFPNAQFPPDRNIDGPANESEMTPVPSFGKMSADQDDKNTKSVSNMTSDNRIVNKTTSSVSGSDPINFSDHKFANESQSKAKTAKKKSSPGDAESLVKTQHLDAGSLGDSVTDIMNPNTDLKQISFEQQQEHQEISPVGLNVPQDDHHEAFFMNAEVKDSPQKLNQINEFDTQDIANQIEITRKSISKTPDASNEKTFNAQFYNQSFSADLELQNGMNSQLPVFDEEPIAVDPELSEQLESDDGEILQNIVSKSNNQEFARDCQMHTEKGKRELERRKSQQPPRTMFGDTDSQTKLRRLSEKGGLQRLGSFGAQDVEGKKIQKLQNTSFNSNHDKKRKPFTAFDGSIDFHNSPKSFKLSMSDWSGENVENLRIKTTSQPQIIGSLTAEYGFGGEKSKDLSFKAGDQIQVLKVRDKDWWLGMTQDGKKGFFPINYMSKCSQLTSMKQDRNKRKKSLNSFT